MTPTILAAVALSGGGLLNAVIWLVCAALVYFIVDWGLGQIGLPEPFAKIARVLLVVLVVLVCLNAILMLAGAPLFTVG